MLLLLARFTEVFSQFCDCLLLFDDEIEYLRSPAAVLLGPAFERLYDIVYNKLSVGWRRYGLAFTRNLWYRSQQHLLILGCVAPELGTDLARLLLRRHVMLLDAKLRLQRLQRILGRPGPQAVPAPGPIVGQQRRRLLSHHGPLAWHERSGGHGCLLGAVEVVGRALAQVVSVIIERIISVRRRRLPGELVAQSDVRGRAVPVHLPVLVNILIRSLRHPLNLIRIPHILDRVPPLQRVHLEKLVRERAVQLVARELVKLHVQDRGSAAGGGVGVGIGGGGGVEGGGLVNSSIHLLQLISSGKHITVHIKLVPLQTAKSLPRPRHLIQIIH